MCCCGGIHAELRSDADGSLLLLVPVDLELGYARLFDEDVACKLADVRLSRRVLVKFGELISVSIVDIVADPEELLIVVVRAGEQDGSHADDV